MSKKILSLQMLRAIAVALVVLIHAAADRQINISSNNFVEHFFNLKYWGFIGVDLFFCISGFIMTIVVPSYLKEGGWKKFAIKRVVRIIPLYYLITLFDLAIAVLKHHKPLDLQALSKSFLFFPFFDQATFVKPYTIVGWTLSYEMYFYLLVCLMICLKRNVYRNLLIVIAVLSIIGTCLDPVNPLIKFLTSPLLLEFGMGVICGLIYERANTIAFPNNTYKFVSLLLIVLGIGLSCISLFILPTHNGNMLGELTTVANNNMAALKRVIIMGVPSAIFLMGAVFYEKHFNTKIPFVLILCGDASYSCYLIHMHTYPAIAKVFNALHINTNIFLLLLIPICLGISVIFYKVVEKPLTHIAEKIAHRLVSKQRLITKPV